MKRYVLLLICILVSESFCYVDLIDSPLWTIRDESKNQEVDRKNSLLDGNRVIVEDNQVIYFKLPTSNVLDGASIEISYEVNRVQANLQMPELQLNLDEYSRGENSIVTMKIIKEYGAFTILTDGKSTVVQISDSNSDQISIAVESKPTKGLNKGFSYLTLRRLVIDLNEADEHATRQVTSPSGQPIPQSGKGWNRFWYDDFENSAAGWSSSRWYKYSQRPGNGDPYTWWNNTLPIAVDGMGVMRNNWIQNVYSNSGISSRIDYSLYGFTGPSRFDVRIRAEKSKGIGYSVTVLENNELYEVGLTLGGDQGGDRSFTNCILQTRSDYIEQQYKIDMTQWHTLSLIIDNDSANISVDGTISANVKSQNLTGTQYRITFQTYLTCDPVNYTCLEGKNNVSVYVDWVAVFSPAPYDPSLDSPITQLSSNTTSEKSSNSNLVIALAIAIPASIGVTVIVIVVAVLLLRRRGDRGRNQHNSSEIPMSQTTKNNSHNSQGASYYTSVPFANSSNNSVARPPPKPASIGRAPLPQAPKGHYNWTIDYNEIEISTELGRGAFGVVYLGLWRNTKVAVKQVNVSDNSKEEAENFAKEINLMMSIRPHTNVIALLGVSLHPRAVVTEFMPNGSLSAFLSSKKTMNPNLMKKIISGIANGMLHLHKEGVIHRDLAARNILLTGDLEPKISDFGLSRINKDKEEENQTKSMVGPLKWMAPESLKNRIYSFKTDVWSFGITTIEVLTRDIPYPNEDAVSVAAQVMLQGYKPVTPPKTPPVLAQILDQCFQGQPNQRPDFAEICSKVNTM